MLTVWYWNLHVEDKVSKVVVVICEWRYAERRMIPFICRNNLSDWKRTWKYSGLTGNGTLTFATNRTKRSIYPLIIISVSSNFCLDCNMMRNWKRFSTKAKNHIRICCFAVVLVIYRQWLTRNSIRITGESKQGVGLFRKAWGFIEELLMKFFSMS